MIELWCQPTAWWQSIFCRCSQSLKQPTHRPQDCSTDAFKRRLKTWLFKFTDILQLFYQCFHCYHYHHRYYYPYHHVIINIMLCAISLYMYCGRRNTNDCFHSHWPTDIWHWRCGDIQSLRNSHPARHQLTVLTVAEIARVAAYHTGKLCLGAGMWSSFLCSRAFLTGVNREHGPCVTVFSRTKNETKGS